MLAHEGGGECGLTYHHPMKPSHSRTDSLDASNPQIRYAIE